MSPRTERFRARSLGGVALQALHWGDPSRAVLVLLHGGGANAHWWDHVAPALAEEHHVVALDFRGHGGSDYPDETPVGAFSDDLDALLEHLRAPDAALVGHSMGAHIALDRAARVSGTRALALVDLAWQAPQAARRAARRALSLRLSYPSREAALARFRFVPTAARAPESLRRAIAEHSLRQEANGRWGFAFDPRWFSLPYRKLPPLSRLETPVLILRGAESPLLEPAAARGLAAELPRAELAEVAGAGHHVHLEQPQAVIAALRRFLRQAR